MVLSIIVHGKIQTAHSKHVERKRLLVLKSLVKKLEAFNLEDDGHDVTRINIQKQKRITFVSEN